MLLNYTTKVTFIFCIGSKHDIKLRHCRKSYITLVLRNLSDFQLFHFIQTFRTLKLGLIQVGVAVYGRYSSTVPPVSYLAHIWGSLAGITIGLVVLKTFQQKLWERWVWWTALFIYSAFIIAAFVANLIA